MWQMRCSSPTNGSPPFLWGFYLLIAVVLFQFIAPIAAVKTGFDSEPLSADHYLAKSYAMYKKGDIYGDGPSYFQYNLNFSKKVETEQKIFQDRVFMILFHSDVMDFIGKEMGGHWQLCCSMQSRNDGDCDDVGAVAFEDEIFNHQDKFQLWTIPWNELDQINPQDNPIQNIKGRSYFKYSGIYRLYIISCAKDEDAPYDNYQTVVVDGDMVWMNPYGHLPGDTMGNMFVFFFLFIGYISVGICWLILSILYRKDLMGLQNVIALVLVIGSLENFINTIDYFVYNRTGVISLGFNVISVFLSVGKKTVSYVALLLAVWGYSVVKPSLDKKNKIYLICIATLYVIFDFIYELSSMLRYTPDTYYLNVPSGLEIAFLFFTSVLDFTLIFSIFLGLLRTIKTLTDEKQVEKLKMYKRLSIILSVFYFFCIIFFCIQLGALADSKYNAWWRGWAIFDTFYYIIFFIFILPICIIWRPSPNNSRYAYSEQVADEPTTGGSGRRTQNDREENTVDLPEIHIEEKEGAKAKNEEEGGERFSIE